MKHWGWIFGILAAAIGAPSLAADPAEAEPFGFSGKEIFPIEQGIGLLRTADLNGDGLLDLTVANNNRSRITFLLNRTGQPDPEGDEAASRRPNELPPDARFRIDSIASEKRIASLVVTDLNGDGAPDIAYYGEPRELIVQLQEDEEWGVPKRWAIKDGQLNGNALAEGDLNDDGLRDLVLLGENHIYLLTQSPQHILQEPVKIPFSGDVKGIQILDVNGDGLDDLLMVDWDSPNPIRFRYQLDSGELGAEIYFALAPLRAFRADDLDGKGEPEIVTIARRSGRARLGRIERQPAEPLSDHFNQGQFEVLPLDPTSSAERGVLWADVDGDGREDLLAAEPDSGQVTLYLGSDQGQLTAPQRFPSLTDITEMVGSDWDQDGRTDVFVLSSAEQEIGVTRLQEDRLPFPEILPIEGRPLAAAAGVVFPDQGPLLVVLVEESGSRTVQFRTPEGSVETVELDEDYTSNPARMVLHDLDQDDLKDVVFLTPYQEIKVLHQQEGETFEELDVAPPGGTSAEPWLSRVDIDGDNTPELLLGKNNFVRAVTLARQPSNGWRLEVKEQINGATSNSRLVGAAMLPSSRSPSASGLFLLDAHQRALTLCERNESDVWEVVRNIELPVGGLSRLSPLGSNEEKPTALGFVGHRAVASMRFEGEIRQYKMLDGYETPIRDGQLADILSGDLNDDGRKDLIFLETAENHIDIVRFEPPNRLLPGNRWRVFEERSFRSGRGPSQGEPREAAVGDFTDDGKQDLALIVHDRILLYPQEH